MGKVKYTLLVPKSFNDGSAVPDDLFEKICDMLYAIAGGYSIRGAVQGAYRMADGSKKLDWSTEISINLDESDVPELRDVVSRIGRELGQEAMYLERTNSEVELIPPAGHEVVHEEDH